MTHQENIQDTWEERFDSEFPELSVMSNNQTYRNVADREKVKDFISNLIASTKQQMVEKLEKEIMIHKEIMDIYEVYPEDWHRGNVDALSHIITIIKEL